MADKVRLNLNLPQNLADKLDETSAELSLNKTSVVIVALNQFFQQRDTAAAMPDLKRFMDLVQSGKFDDLSK